MKLPGTHKRLKVAKAEIEEAIASLFEDLAAEGLAPTHVVMGLDVTEIRRGGPLSWRIKFDLDVDTKVS